MANTKELQKAAEKIVKLLNIMNDESASEGERENARKFIDNIMQKHNMTMTDVDSLSQGDIFKLHIKDASKEDEWYETPNEGANQLFQKVLKSFGVVYMSTPNRMEFVIVGRKIDVDLAVAIYDTLEAKIYSEFEKDRAEYRKDPHNRGKRYTYDQYIRGFVDKVDLGRLLDSVTSYKREATVTAKGTGSDIVAVSNAIAERYGKMMGIFQDYLSELGLHRCNHRARTSYGAAYGAGADYSGRVKVHNPVSGKAPAQITA